MLNREATLIGADSKLRFAQADVNIWSDNRKSSNNARAVLEIIVATNKVANITVTLRVCNHSGGDKVWVAGNICDASIDAIVGSDSVSIWKTHWSTGARYPGGEANVYTGDTNIINHTDTRYVYVILAGPLCQSSGSNYSWDCNDYFVVTLGASANGESISKVITTGTYSIPPA